MSNIITWIIFGIIVGVVASIITNSNKKSIPGNIVMCVIGALIGGFTVDLISHDIFTGVNLYSSVLAAAGAVIVLLTYKTITDQV